MVTKVKFQYLINMKPLYLYTKSLDIVLDLVQISTDKIMILILGRTAYFDVLVRLASGHELNSKLN